MQNNAETAQPSRLTVRFVPQLKPYSATHTTLILSRRIPRGYLRLHSNQPIASQPVADGTRTQIAFFTLGAIRGHNNFEKPWVVLLHVFDIGTKVPYAVVGTNKSFIWSAPGSKYHTVRYI